MIINRSLTYTNLLNGGQNGAAKHAGFKGRLSRPGCTGLGPMHAYTSRQINLHELF
ncbi:MAG: hypothetical protein HQ557_19860 [Bacteroidetes bacterium]|nr:hypothetical protein [Bacteroidota bacterium]